MSDVTFVFYSELAFFKADILPIHNIQTPLLNSNFGVFERMSSSAGVAPLDRAFPAAP